MNLYAYCLSNPVGAIDRTGTMMDSVRATFLRNPAFVVGLIQDGTLSLAALPASLAAQIVQWAAQHGELLDAAESEGEYGIDEFGQMCSMHFQDISEEAPSLQQILEKLRQAAQQMGLNPNVRGTVSGGNVGNGLQFGARVTNLTGGNSWLWRIRMDAAHLDHAAPEDWFHLNPSFGPFDGPPIGFRYNRRLNIP